VYKFCSRSCSSKHAVKSGRTCLGNKEYEALRGKEAADLRKHKKSIASARKNTGRVLSDASKKKIAASCAGVPNVLKGKTFEKFYGAERAALLSAQHSERLKEGFASGRIKPTARSRSAPVFRGVRLRSLLEQSAIEFLELRDGLVFGETLTYEDPATRVQWCDLRGRSHTYHPDLFDKKNNVVYEVKPAWLVAKPTEEMTRKFSALELTGKKSLYLTDADIKEFRNATR
jgi:hypothetical protein